MKLAALPAATLPALSLKSASSLRNKLLAWYDKNRRTLPWREQPSPYAVLVSEIMLQQTRVETVIPYFHRWMNKFPSVKALACAKTEEVLQHWAGLGYYRRAHNLHAAAKEIHATYGKNFPSSEEELRNLPGIGRYTAGAILSIAFIKKAPLVDGNVARVLCRLFDLRDPYPSPVLEKKLWHAATELVPNDRPGDFNQALMELGALVCTPGAPACKRCPLVALCQANRAGNAQQLPVRKAKKAVRTVRAACALIVHGDEVLLSRRDHEGLWAGLWEPPWQEIAPDRAPEDALDELLQRRSELTVRRIQPFTMLQHGLTHFDLQLYASIITLRRKAKSTDESNWFASCDLVTKHPPVALAAWSKRLFQQLVKHIEGARND